MPVTGNCNVLAQNLQLDIEICACVHMQSSVANLNLDPYMVSAEFAVMLGARYQIVQDHCNPLRGYVYAD